MYFQTVLSPGLFEVMVQCAALEFPCINHRRTQLPATVTCITATKGHCVAPPSKKQTHQMHLVGPEKPEVEGFKSFNVLYGIDGCQAL